MLEKLRASLWRLLGPTDRQVEAAAMAHCNHHVGLGNSIWDSPLTDRPYRVEAMRAALEAARRA